MPPIRLSSPITAILYGDGEDIAAAMTALTGRFQDLRLSVAGFVERKVERPGRTRCDMVLEELASGQVVGISQDRGPGARGCRLDLSELLRATELARSALRGGCDLLVVNKFGKTEAEGGGFRDLICEAVDRGVPVVVGVPLRNLDAWRAFAGDLSRDVPVARIGHVAAGFENARSGHLVGPEPVVVGSKP